MVIQRDPNHCDLRPFEKNNKPKRAPPPLGWGRKKKKEKKEDAQYTNINCKTENDWMRSSGHTFKIKACIQSATSLNLAVDSSSEPA